MARPEVKYPKTSGITVVLAADEVLNSKRAFGSDNSKHSVSIRRDSQWTREYKIRVGCETLYATDRELVTLRKLIEQARRLP